MKNILYPIIICCLFSLHNLFAQQGFIMDFTGPGATNPSKIIQTTDGNYAFTIAASEGLHNNPQGPGNYLIRIDQNGNILQNIRINGLTYFADLFPTNDNGVLIGTRKDFTGNMHQPYIIKVDETGAIEWKDFFISHSGDFTETLSILNLENGDFLFASGEIGSATIDFIQRRDSNLNVLWTREVDATEYDICEAISGNIFIIPRASKNVIIFSSQGNLISEKNVEWNFQGFSATPTPDGGCLLTATHAPADVETNKVHVKLNSTGEVLWSKPILNTSLEYTLTQPLKLSDGILFPGAIQNILPNDDSALLFLKIDFEGNVLWQNQTDILSVAEQGFSLKPTNDGGLIGIAKGGNWQEYSAYLFKSDEKGNIFDNVLTGTVARETIENCEIDPGEITLENWILSASNTNETFYTITDSDGKYILPLETGDYILSVFPPNNTWSPCANDIPVTLNSGASVTTDFPIEAVWDCPRLAVNTSLPRARPCFDNNRYYIDYCNEGTATAVDAEVTVVTDPQFSFVSASIAPTSQNTNTYVFSLGDIASGECGLMYIDFMLDCDAVLGSSVCIETTIGPLLECIPTDPNWNGAFVEVDITCQDSLVKFTLENVGTNDMDVPSQYIVIEDAILMMQDDFMLNEGMQESFSIPSTGGTQRLIAEQVMLAPGDPYPTAWVEGCGVNDNGNYSIGFVNQFSLGDNIPHVDTDCSITTASYDPNDKQGFPNGYGVQHLIEPNTPIEYLIRFQNTGTDTAFNVVLRDLIAEELDITTIRFGGSSHPYTWNISGENKLEFIFQDILLPDSTTNESESHGFVEFKIMQQLDLPLGTIINNKAEIYFDFNDAIITYETFHQIGINFVTVHTQNPDSPKVQFNIYPNPFHQTAMIQFQDFEFVNGKIEIFDMVGKSLVVDYFTGSSFNLHRRHLTPGIYAFRILEKNEIVNTGRIIVK